MANIEDNLEPACEAMMTLIEEIDKLKELEEKYIKKHGKKLPNGEMSQCDVEVDTDNYNSLKEKYEELDAKTEEMEARKYEDVIVGYNKMLTQTGVEVDDLDNPITEQRVTAEYTAWLAEKNTAKAKYDGIKIEDTQNLNALNEQQLVVIEAWYKVKNYETTVQSYKDYFTEGTSQYSWLHGDGNTLDMDSMISNYTNIVSDFEDYSRMPVISDLSKYKVGDVIAFDDSEGFVYAVTGEFDPLTGTITIACHDKDGNKVGTDVSIWDQREIVKVEVLKNNNYDEYYNDFPNQFETTPDGKSIVYQTTVPPTSGGGGGPTSTAAETTADTTPEPSGGTPATTTETTPGTTATTPGTTATTPGTTATTPGTTATTPGTTVETTVPIVETIPYIEVQTIPYTTYEYTGEGGGSGYSGYGGEYSPHTGLDAIYNTGETKQSATGLGALAGLAAGAAGLGLTGLVGDKKEKEDDEEEKDEDYSDIIEEKPFEEKEGVSQNNEEQPNTFNGFNGF